MVLPKKNRQEKKPNFFVDSDSKDAKNFFFSILQTICKYELENLLYTGLERATP